MNTPVHIIFHVYKGVSVFPFCSPPFLWIEGKDNNVSQLYMNVHHFYTLILSPKSIFVLHLLSKLRWSLKKIKLSNKLLLACTSCFSKPDCWCTFYQYGIIMQLLERIGPATEKLKKKGIDFSLWYKPENYHTQLWERFLWLWN